jgi:class 3 adenylate cyclase
LATGRGRCCFCCWPAWRRRPSPRCRPGRAAWPGWRARRCWRWPDSPPSAPGCWCRPPLCATAAGLALLGTLGWRLTGEERERARLRQLFGRYVSDQVVDALLRSGSRPELGGQSQTVTVLFSDIRNFTTLSERLDAKEVVEMLNTYFERACAPLLAEGGSIDKFIGDAVMVEFGSPLPVPDHAICVRCAPRSPCARSPRNSPAGCGSASRTATCRPSPSASACTAARRWSATSAHRLAWSSPPSATP